MRSLETLCGATVLLLGPTLLCGCATMVSGRDATVSINSTPDNAHVAVRNQEGEVVATGATPMQVNLDRSRGLLKKPPSYTATLQKPGFQPQKISIDPKLNPWLAGNVVLGGPIGLVADSATGAMWNLKPNKIDQQLKPAGGKHYARNANARDGVKPVSYVSDRSSQ